MLDGKLLPGPHGGSIVAFERRIDRPVEKVWAALTVPERVSDWLASADIVLEVGGRYDLRFHDSDDAMAGAITRLEPPHLLELTWRENDGSESTLLWTLEADGDGCRLNLVHTFPTDVRDVPGFVSGWHQHLDAVTAACDGAATPWDPARWKALDERYRVSLAAGIPTDEDRFGVFLDGGRALRFERLFPGPIERVWDWLTKPELVELWFTQQRIEPWVGGKVEGSFGAGDAWTATVTDWSPPHRLGWRDPQGAQTLWELTSEGDLVRTVFVQSGLPPHAGVGSGWHAYFDALQERMAGREPPGHGALWTRVQAEYEARFARAAEFGPEA